VAVADGYILGTPGDDVLEGGVGNETLNGYAGNDILRGGGGSDQLIGGPGDDLYDGGDGDDYAFFSQAFGVRIDLAIQGAQDTGEGRDTFISVENLIGSGYADILRGTDTRNELQGAAGDDFLDGRGGDDFLVGGAGADEIRGGAGNDLIVGDDGNDLLFGEAGDDTFIGGFGVDLYDGGAGVDTVVFFTDTGVTVDLALTGRQEVAPSMFGTFVSIERIQTSNYADKVWGNASDNDFWADRGNDFLDGRGGYDTYVTSAKLSDLTIVWTGDGWRVTDNRTDGDGVDILKNIEILRSEGYGPTRFLGDGMSFIVGNILRLDGGKGDSYIASLSARLDSGALTTKAAQAEVIDKAAGTTSIASLSYQFFTGKIPTQGGIDYLVSPTGPNAQNLNASYYERFDPVNRFINFAVNLGKNGEGKDSFAAKYGVMSLFDATKEAYKAIFGGTPTDAKVHALIDGRVDYLAYYGGDGPSGIGTKAAMVGFLLAAAATEHVGVMARSNDAWLNDLADGDAPFAVDLLNPSNGYYKTDFIFGG